MNAPQQCQKDLPLGDVGLVGLMGHRWSGEWMGAMQMFHRLARYFRIVWVNPPLSWRSSDWRRQWGLGGRISVETCARCAPGLTVCEPSRWAPAVGGPPVIDRLLTRWRYLPALRLLDQVGCEKRVAYLWRPKFAAALDSLNYDVSCYHINDEYTFSRSEVPLGRQEFDLISGVDQVFIHSPQLMEKKGHINPNTLIVPNGVDYQRFAAPAPEPDDMRHIPRPRMGYVGQIKSQLDLRLVLTLAQRHAEWSFVLVGPQKRLRDAAHTFQELQSLPNVHWLGNRPVNTLPAYVQCMDVCLLCYVMNDYTRFIYPLKLHEYLAAGRPVVGAPIPTLLEFEDVIRLARTPDEWSAALSSSLANSENESAKVAKRRAVARAHDWDRMVARIGGAICRHLGPSYEERFAAVVGQPDGE